MTGFFIVLILFIILCLLSVWYVNTYNRFQNLIIRINEVEANIDTTLRKRFDLLNKSVSIIKANADIDGDVLELIVKLRSRKLSNFDLDRQLYEAINEFRGYLENYPSLKEQETLQKVDMTLNESEHEITAFRKYYNDTITEYNTLVRKFPTMLVAKLSKYKEKTYFDGKDMSDDITNDFKL